MNFVYLVFLALAWVGIECFIGGTRLLYSLPAYSLIAFAAILSLISIRGKRVSPNAFCIGSTLLLGAWVLYRSVHSPVEYLALPDFFMMIGCLMVYLLTAFYLSGLREQTVLISVLWAIAGLEVWVALAQFINDQNFMLFGLLRPVLARPSGMYISPNNFAGFLIAVAILSISLGVWSRWRIWAKILAFYVAAFCLIGVAISGSRGGYFDTIGSLLCFAVGSIYVVRTANPRKFLLVATATFGGIALVLGFAAFLMTHSAYLTDRMQRMVVKDVRIYNWQAALDHIRLSPWIGTGSGTHLIYGRLFRRPPIQVDPVHAHCDYLELIAEYGIAGAACMALFLTAHIRKALRTFSAILRQRFIPSGLHRSNRFALQFGALCAVVGLAIHSVVDFDMHIPGNALVFAFLFGMLANPEIQDPPAVVDRRVTPWIKLLLPALGLFMLWRGMPMLPSEYCSEIARRALRNHNFLDSIAYAKKGIGPGTTPPPSPAADADPADEPELLDKLLAKAGPNPRNPDLYFYLGEANRGLAMRMGNLYLRQNYYGRAATAFEAGLKLFPEDESMLIRYGQVLDGLHRFPDAEVVYQKALTWDPKLDTLHEYYESHLAAEGKKAEAAALARERQESRPNEVDAGPKGDFRLQ